MRKRCVLVLLMLCLFWAAPFARASLLTPALPGKTLLNAAQNLNSYEIHATFDPEGAALDCVQQVRYVNHTGEKLETLVFRIYANAFSSAESTPSMTSNGDGLPFSKGGITFTTTLVDGREASPTLAGEDLTQLVFAIDIPPDERVEIEMSYRVELPKYAYRFGASDGYYMFDHAFPVLAVYEEGAYRNEDYLAVGDPFYSECANFMLYLTLPEDYSVATSGALRAEETRDQVQKATYEALAVRDFGLVITRKQSVEKRFVGDVLVQSYAQTRSQAREALDAAEQSLLFYLEYLGDTYPYPVLTIAQADLGFMGGMEYPALAVINQNLYQRGHEINLQRAIAHEIAHQWFYAQVGTDQIKDPWLDEGLAEYLSAVAVREICGQDAYWDFIYEEIEPAMRISLPPGVVISSPLWQYVTWSEYDRVAYKRSAGMMYGLHLALGDEGFASALCTFFANHRFGIAGREDFAAALEEATGSNWRGYLDDYLDSRD